MSNTDSNPSDPSTDRPEHPLLSILPLNHPNGAAETLDFCSDHLWLLADLFGSNQSDYAVLSCESTRRAMWRQLVSVAQSLEAVSKALQSTSNAT